MSDQATPNTEPLRFERSYTVDSGYAGRLSSAVIRYAFLRQIPPGSVYRIGFGDESFLLGAPLSTSTVSYRLYSKAVRSGDFVILANASRRAVAALPVELFTPESLDWFNHHLAK